MGENFLDLGRRTGVAALFALLLAVRLLTPGGFMPQFDRGQIVIVACDDAAPQGHHGHDKGKAKHSQPCPYGAASALNGLDQPTPTFVPPPRATSSLASSILLRSPVTASHAPRPPSRAPPTSI